MIIYEVRHLDLFSGIGGFALSARWMSWKTVQFVEIDPFCQAVLRKNFNGVPIHGDIKTFNGESLRGTIDILTGGFPCQPFSLAGMRKGTKDNRHVWPEMLRVVREVRPCFVVAENVPGIYSQESGLVFEQICADMETEGYEVQPISLPAGGKEAPHIRERFWFVAYLNGVRRKRDKIAQENNYGWPGERLVKRCKPYSIHRISRFANVNESGLSVGVQPGECIYERQTSTLTGRKPPRIYTKTDWREFPTESPVLRGDDGVPNRMDRIKSLGNAIVPQVALEIFKAIEATMKV